MNRFFSDPCLASAFEIDITLNGLALHISDENRSPKTKLSDCKMFENAAVLVWEDEKRKFRRR